MNESNTEIQITTISDEDSEPVQVSELTLHLSNMSIVSPTSTTLSTCMSGGCNSETNPHMFTCSKCKQVIHYECTRLPEYQIYLFTIKNYQHYICKG